MGQSFWNSLGYQLFLSEKSIEMLLRISHLGLLLCLLLIEAGKAQAATSEGYEKYEDALECSFCLDNEDYNRCLDLEEAEWKKIKKNVTNTRPIAKSCVR